MFAAGPAAADQYCDADAGFSAADNVVVEFVTETGVRKRQRLKRRKKKSASANSGDASLMVGADQDGGIDDGFVSGVEDIDSDLEVATDSEEDVKK